MSWDISRANKGDGTYSSVKSYQETRVAGAGEELLTYSDTVCLQPGTFRFTILDSAGDGICCSYGQGSYSLTNKGGEIVVTGGDYGAGEATTFDWPMFASTVNTTGVLLN